MYRIVRSLLLAFPCAACASIATTVSGSQASIPAVAGSREMPGTTLRRIFRSQLQGDRGARDEPASATTGPRAATRAWGTVRIVLSDDDSFEYLLTLYNPAGETFTSAHVHRGEENESDHGEMVATLFSDVSIDDRYVQLRGTVLVGRDQRAAVLASEMRERPGDFEVKVHTMAHPDGPIRGRIE